MDPESPRTAYTAVDNAESEQNLVRAINAEAPAVTAEEAKKIGAFLIHFSTDYVFDGAKMTPYDEDDPSNPQNVYGRTKFGGERAIQASEVPYLIFRTAWVYEIQGRNFLLTILRLATQREELRIVRDQIGSPTLGREIAHATTKSLAQIRDRERSPLSLADVSGIYNMTAGGETSWYDFAKAILEDAAMTSAAPPWLAAATGNLPLVTRRVIPISTSEHLTPARRPGYSVLSNARLARTFSLQLPAWREQLHSIFAAPAPEK